VTQPKGDYYALLGVERTASADEIRRAFRRLAARAHPDIRPNDPHALAHFQRLSQAYHTLSEPSRRAAYDGFDADGAVAPVVTPARAAELQAEELRHRYARGYAAGWKALCREEIRRLVSLPGSLPAPRTPEEMGFQDALRARLGAEMRARTGGATGALGPSFAVVPSGRRSDGTG